MAWVSASETAFTAASESTGDLVGIAPSLGRLYVPESYWPPAFGGGSYISNSTTWAGESLSSLGLTEGTTATWTWGSGSTADSLVINVIPEPASGALVVLAGGVLVGRRRWTGARRG